MYYGILYDTASGKIQGLYQSEDLAIVQSQGQGVAGRGVLLTPEELTPLHAYRVMDGALHKKIHVELVLSNPEPRPGETIAVCVQGVLEDDTLEEGLRMAGKRATLSQASAFLWYLEVLRTGRIYLWVDDPHYYSDICTLRVR